MTGPAYMHPDEGNTSWHTQAACTNADTNIFYPAQGSGHKKDWAAAKAICANCPVKQPCLEYALATNQTDGLWGGRTPDQRRKLRPAYRKAHRTCIDCRTTIGHKGPNCLRCDTCAFTHKRQRQYEHARLQRLGSPPR